MPSIRLGLGVDMSGSSNLTAPITEFKTNQSVLTQLLIQRITVLPGKTVNINWGDGTDVDLTGVNLNITKDYSVINAEYTITLSGDVDDIQYFEWMGAYDKLFGDLTGKRLWKKLEWFHFYYNNCTGNLESLLNNLPPQLEILHLGRSSALHYFTGSVDRIKWPSTISDIHFEGNQFTGNPFKWTLPDPFVPDEGHINLDGNNWSGSGLNWTLTEGIGWIRFNNTPLICNVSEWVLPSTLSTIYFKNSGFYGDISGWVLPTDVQPYTGFEFNFSGCNITGDLSSWILPNNKGYVGELKEFNEIDLNSCNITKMPRGYFRHFKICNFGSNNCNQEEIDDFLAYLDAYFVGGVVPTTNCVYTLSGEGMAAPSAAGLASRTSIINKYIAAGKVATINYYVDLAEPTNLTVTTVSDAGDRGLKLDWTDNSGGTALYEIWKSIDGGLFTLKNTTLAGVHTYTDTPVNIGTSIEYKVRSVDSMLNYTTYISKTVTLGAELVDQTAWKTVPGATYWNKYFSGNWSVDGTKLISSGANGDLGRTAFWTTGKIYKVAITITRVGGSVRPPMSTAASTPITSSETYNMKVGASQDLYMYSALFNGTITGLSIKEIIVT